MCLIVSDVQVFPGSVCIDERDRARVIYIGNEIAALTEIRLCRCGQDNERQTKNVAPKHERLGDIIPRREQSQGSKAERDIAPDATLGDHAAGRSSGGYMNEATHCIFVCKL